MNTNPDNNHINSILTNLFNRINGLDTSFSKEKNIIFKIINLYSIFTKIFKFCLFIVLLLVFNIMLVIYFIIKNIHNYETLLDTLYNIAYTIITKFNQLNNFISNENNVDILKTQMELLNKINKKSNN